MTNSLDTLSSSQAVLVRETPIEETLRRDTEAERAGRMQYPSHLDKPAFVMNLPFSYCTRVANNPWMEDLPPKEREPDRRKAMCQFLQLYHYVASEAVVLFLPAPADCTLQDLVFTANMGVVLSHLPGQNTVVISSFSSAPRVPEAKLGRAFFESLGYVVVTPPYKFEGEAELKHLHGNVYAGGYGIRSDIRAHRWMEENFDMKIVKLEETDPYLYHLDGTVFPLTQDTTLVCTELFRDEEIAELESHTEIIDVSVDDALAGICNSVRLSNTILNASHIHDLRAGTEEYASEVRKNRALEDIAASHGFELNFFNIGEYLKGGAMLSCMLMHLNRRSYEFALI